MCICWPCSKMKQPTICNAGSQVKKKKKKTGIRKRGRPRETLKGILTRQAKHLHSWRNQELAQDRDMARDTVGRMWHLIAQGATTLLRNKELAPRQRHGHYGTDVTSDGTRSMHVRNKKHENKWRYCSRCVVFDYFQIIFKYST